MFSGPSASASKTSAFRAVQGGTLDGGLPGACPVHPASGRIQGDVARILHFRKVFHGSAVEVRAADSSRFRAPLGPVDLSARHVEGDVFGVVCFEEVFDVGAVEVGAADGYADDYAYAGLRPVDPATGRIEGDVAGILQFIEKDFGV